MNYSRNQVYHPTFPFTLAQGTNEYILSLRRYMDWWLPLPADCKTSIVNPLLPINIGYHLFMQIDSRPFTWTAKCQKKSPSPALAFWSHFRNVKFFNSMMVNYIHNNMCMLSLG